VTLKQRLERYLRNNHGWIAKGALEKLVMEKTNYTAENAGRRLRELENEGILEVQQRRNHAWYRLKEIKSDLQLASESVAYFNAL
jgi:hypothetical protein